MNKRAFWIFNDNYITPAFLSVASFVENCDEEVNLVYYGSNSQKIQDLFEKISGKNKINIEFIHDDFFSFPVQEFNEEFRNQIKNLELRFFVAEKASADTAIFYFDSDLIFSKDIHELFDLRIENKEDSVLYANIEIPKVIDNTYFFFRQSGTDYEYVNSKIKQHEIYKLIYGDDFYKLLQCPGFNNGVLVFYNTKKLVNKWRDLYLKGLNLSEVNAQEDQLPLAVASHMLGINVAPLSDKFNSKGKVNGEYAIFHAYIGKWEAELINTLTKDSFIKRNFSDVAEIYKSKLNLLGGEETLKNKYILKNEPYLYHSIDDWFFSKSMYRNIFDNIEANSIFVELGTIRGKSICFMAELIKCKNKNIKLFSVDDYDTEHDTYSELFDRSNISFENTCGNLSEIGVIDVVNLINNNSSEALLKFDDESIDCVYIGLDFSFDGMYNNLKNWYKKLKIGGYITGLDYKRADTIKMAVDTFCEEENLPLILKHGGFYIKK